MQMKIGQRWKRYAKGVANYTVEVVFISDTEIRAVIKTLSERNWVGPVIHGSYPSMGLENIEED